MLNYDFNRGTAVMEGILKQLNTLDTIEMKDLPKENTSVVVIDMINGFVREGAFENKKVEAIVPYVEKLIHQFKGYSKLFVVDSHSEDAVEFKTYPVHAVENTSESQILKELIPYVDETSKVIYKNSTNAFFAEAFNAFFSEHTQCKNIVVVGVCTDICVLQFVLSLKAYCNQRNQEINIVVPIQGVESSEVEKFYYDDSLFEASHAPNEINFMQAVSLFMMLTNGIKLVADIKEAL